MMTSAEVLKAAEELSAELLATFEEMKLSHRAALFCSWFFMEKNCAGALKAVDSTKKLPENLPLLAALSKMYATAYATGLSKQEARQAQAALERIKDRRLAFSVGFATGLSLLTTIHHNRQEMEFVMAIVQLPQALGIAQIATPKTPAENPPKTAP